MYSSSNAKFKLDLIDFSRLYWITLLRAHLDGLSWYQLGVCCQKNMLTQSLRWTYKSRCLKTFCSTDCALSDKALKLLSFFRMTLMHKYYCIACSIGSQFKKEILWDFVVWNWGLKTKFCLFPYCDIHVDLHNDSIICTGQI